MAVAGRYAPRCQLDDSRQRDAALRKSLKIKKGMDGKRVIEIMGAKPDVVKGSVWAYRLSPLANTPEERDWTLLIGFEGGKVVSKEVTYACIYAVPRDD